MSALRPPAGFPLAMSEVQLVTFFYLVGFLLSMSAWWSTNHVCPSRSPPPWLLFEYRLRDKLI